jgi:DNA-directed RNA polymerase subunit omega
MAGAENNFQAPGKRCALMDAKKMALIEDLVKKVGGRYKLTVLIQKRLRELNRNSPKLIENNGVNPIDKVLAEIQDDMIELVTEEEYRQYIRAQLENEVEEEEEVVD